MNDECPECGCNARALRSERRFHESLLREFECDHCGHVWNVALEGERARGGVIEMRRKVITAPWCCAGWMRVYSTTVLEGVRTRYWRCDVCNDTTKTADNEE